MRILIIGGTGFVGPHIVLGLHELGHEVTVVHRGRTEADLPAAVRHIHIPADGSRSRHGLTEYRAEFERFAPDVVLDMMPVTEDDARILMSIFGGLAGRVVAISSQDVYRAYGALLGLESGPAQPGPIPEAGPLRERLYPYRTDPPRAADDPQRWMDDYDKIPAERVFLGDPGLPGTILRWPMVYGPRDKQHRLYEYLRKMDDGRPAIVVEERMARWRWTRAYSENVAAAVVLAVTDPQAAGQVYNVGEEDALTTVQWIREIGQAAGWRGEVVAAPADHLPPEMQHGMHVEHDLAIDTTRIRRELGFAELVSRADALARTITWERAHPPEGARGQAPDYAAEDAVLNRLSKGPPPAEGR
jgi:nucleoside-diphosphate-sugar epimerase